MERNWKGARRRGLQRFITTNRYLDTELGLLFELILVKGDQAR
jgi:hypothetical protein